MIDLRDRAATSPHQNDDRGDGRGPVPWADHPRLWSLYDVLRRYAESFYQIGSILGSVNLYLDDKALEEQIKFRDRVDGGAMDRFARHITEGYIATLREQLEAIDLRFSLKALNVLGTEYQTLDAEAIRRALEDLDKRIRHELEERVLFFVGPERAVHYDDFRRGWEVALVKFPITADVEEAEKCFALERWTGCVFHLMRIVEIGVQGLGAYLKIPVAATEAWGKVVREIQIAAQALPHTTASEKETQSKLAEIADALFQVNLAWRIPAMHPRTPGNKYTEEEASDALGRVKALMRSLAATI